MPFIVRSYNKKMNTTYCYECENYKDPDTGEWKSHRKLMGKLDASGNIIPTGKRGRKPQQKRSPDSIDHESKAALKKELERDIRDTVTNEFQSKIISLQQELVSVRKENEKLYAVLNVILRQTNGIAETVQDVLTRQNNPGS